MMKAESIREGMKIGKRRVVKAYTGGSLFVVGRSRYQAPARIVTFHDGSVRAYEIGTDVPVRSGWAESLPAGGVGSKVVRTPDKVRASSGRWRGESVTGMSTRHHDTVARTTMYDTGRVNGSHGVAR